VNKWFVALVYREALGKQCFVGENGAAFIFKIAAASARSE